jgi:serine phosphatase RsbU (regulator of sigma subunit)
VNILLVDDQPASLMALEAALDGRGYNLVRARSGEEALKQLLRRPFALILLDVLMPGMDGFETAALIRDSHRTRETPIVFLTGVGMADDHVARGYAVGAVDYLFKPIVPEILRAKVSVLVGLHEQRERLRGQAERLREHETRLAAVERGLEDERLAEETRAARLVQRALLPTEAPTSPGLDVAGRALLGADVGGDWFDFVPAPAGQLDLVIGSVHGRGLATALLMAATRAHLRLLALEGGDVGDALGLANRALTADVTEGRFVRMLYARLDPHGRALAYAGAGAAPGHLLGDDGRVRATLTSTAPALGLAPEGRFPVGPRLRLASGDTLFLHTDGLLRLTDRAGRTFDVEQALDVVRAKRGRPAEEVVGALEAALCEFQGRQRLEHDVTVLVAISR